MNLVEQLNNERYKDCWLRYAVQRDNLNLLNKYIYYNKDKGRVYIDLDQTAYPPRRDFMSQVLLQDLVNRGYTENNTRDKRLNIQKSNCEIAYGDLSIKSEKYITHTFRAGVRYQHSTDLSLYYNEDNNYNLVLHGIIKIELPKDSAKANIYAYNGNRRLLYMLTPESSDGFMLYRYDMKDAIAKMEEKLNAYNVLFNSYQDDDYLEVYGRKSDVWKHEGGNRHSYKNEFSIRIQLPEGELVFLDRNFKAISEVF